MRRFLLIVVGMFAVMGGLFSAYVRTAAAEEYPVMCGDYFMGGKNMGLYEIVGYSTRDGQAFHLIRKADNPDAKVIETPIDRTGNTPFLRNRRQCPSGKTWIGPDQPKPGAGTQIDQPLTLEDQQVTPFSGLPEVRATEPAPITLESAAKKEIEKTGLRNGAGVLILLLFVSIGFVLALIRWQGRKAKVVV